MHSIDFNDLPQITKQRFIAATANPVARYPASAKAGDGTALWGCLLAVAGLPLLALVASLVVESTDSWKVGIVAIVAFLAFVAFLAGIGVARTGAVKKAHPYPLGTYVFPTQIVVAESKILGLHPLSELINVAIVNHHTRYGYSHSIMTCTFKTARDITLLATTIQEAHRVRDALGQGQQTLLAALARRDYEPLRALDPLFEAQMTGFARVREPGPMVQALPWWTGGGLRFLFALGSTVAFMGLVLLVRAVISAVSPDPDDAPAPRRPVTSAPAPRKNPATR
jgi:hypothetical protein